MLKRSVRLDGENLFAESKQTRSAMLAAMRDLEAALAKAAQGREEAWTTRVVQDLALLEVVMRRQLQELDDENTTLGAVARDQPRFLPRIEQVRQLYADLVQQIGALKLQLSTEGAPPVAEVRQRLAWLLTAIRHFQAKETDLVFEATHVDIGSAD